MLDIMNIESIMKIEYKNSKDAEIAYTSLLVDNKGFINSELNENIVNFSYSSETLGTYLNTIDDLIASEILIEKLLNKSSSRN